MEDKLIIEYTDKIENLELGYTLYLNLNNDLEYWYDFNTRQLHWSRNAGDNIYEAFVAEDEYELKGVIYGC